VIHNAHLDLSAGGLGILCPRLRTAPDFVLTMTTVCCRATTGFFFHKSLLPHTIHDSLQYLFTIESNTESLFLQRLHRLLPHFASIGTSPTTPTASRITTFLRSTSPKSARNRIKKYCTATYTKPHTTNSQRTHHNIIIYFQASSPRKRLIPSTACAAASPETASPHGYLPSA
jgi:hypothetical protein